MARDLRLDLSSGRYRHASEVQGMALDRDSWRWMFVGSYKGWRTVPAIEGSGFIMLGASSKTLDVNEACDVIEMVEAFGAERGVKWTLETDGNDWSQAA